MIVDLPQPVGPTIAMRSPGAAFIDTCSISGLSGRYEKHTSRSSMLPRMSEACAAAESSGSSSASSTSKTRFAQDTAFCSSATTPEISLKGLVYWFA